MMIQTFSLGFMVYSMQWEGDWVGKKHTTNMIRSKGVQHIAVQRGW